LKTAPDWGLTLTHIQEVAGSKPAAPTSLNPYKYWVTITYSNIINSLQTGEKSGGSHHVATTKK